MPIEVRLPQLAESMTSAKLAAWLKREGDSITTGEPLAEVETDKTNVELEAPSSGVLQKLYVAAGTDVAVGTLLAVIAEQSSRTEPSQPTPQADSGKPAPVGAAQGRSSSAAVASAAADRGNTPAAAPAPAASVPPAESPGEASAPKIAATPLAIRMAKLAGLDLSAIQTRAAGARITKADVETALRHRRSSSGMPNADPAAESPLASPLTRASETSRSSAPGSFEDRALSAMRRVTAARLQQAKQMIPHFYLRVDCVIDALMDLRAKINGRNAGVKVTVTDFIVLAAALALRKVPLANSAWMDTAVRVFDSVDIAVAVNTPNGLIAPIVRASHLKTLGVISRELKELSERARKGQLKPDEYTGGTFTISNLGMFGVTSITPIINPPQSCILGVGAIEQRPVVTDGQLAVGRVMSCTIAADHRAVDGATGAELLAEIRRLIEDPISMALQV